ncbi:MAG: hypothetical protein K8F91_04600 [Candidatus Obscuribacterales bacterium]|nr:hypothetical protein [Candidatus Obscuribacterales bacterium]
MSKPFQMYVALGDSMNIDSYPYYDGSDRNDGELPLGVASLLYKNCSSR